VFAVDRQIVAPSTCARCKVECNPGELCRGYCSLECELCAAADRERHKHKLQKMRVWTVLIACISVIVAGTALRIDDYVVATAQAQHVGIHVRGVKSGGAESKTALRDAFVATRDGASEVAYPTVATFCRALRLKGEAESTVSGEDLPDKELAIDVAAGAQYVSGGDLVEVFSEMSTTCNGELRRLPERVSLIRDVRSGVSGWVLSQSLSNG